MYLYFEYWNGEDFENLYLVEKDEHTATIATDYNGKIRVCKYDLLGSEDHRYIEYGPAEAHVYMNEFQN